MSKTSKNTKNKQIVRLSAFLAAGILGTPNGAVAQSFSCPISLLFGNYTTCASTQTATVTPGNSRTTSGCLSTGGAPYNRAQCNYTAGTLPVPFQFSVTATQYKITNTTGDKMTVDNFSCRFQTSATITGACNQTVTPFFAIIDIGARLTVGNPQGSGTYSGTFTVTTNIP
ncbi:MAG: DUF4402 domain-containing protein [Rhodospirillales bacterium]|nr:DUF4402 domain-containing protein [Rhodospirillales bacterium]MCB9994900.1 DUF4402 domain-containing protein [Rhodospirillales bacterium]